MRRIVVLFLVGSGMTLAQSTLPATSPTVVPATTPAISPKALPAPTPAAATPTPAIVDTRISYPANVSYVQGKLQIAANNSSLNQILREISRLTGMTITGGVTDQRVFGNYGPAPPADILAVLLDGTGTNMFLRNNSSNAPAELILTPRQGGPTPPSPNASGFNAANDSGGNSLKPPQPNQPPAVGPDDPLTQAAGRSRFGTMPAQNSSSGPAATGINSGTDPPPAGNAPSPNGVPTPQQIYQQLQQLQHAQPQQ